MPPKKTAAAKGKDVPDANEPPVPDPTVLVYLAAASRAFPHIDRLFGGRTANLETQVVNAKTTAVEEAALAEKIVTQFAAERLRLRAEIEELKVGKQKLKQSVADNEGAFQRTLSEKTTANAAHLEAMGEEITRLGNDAEEAERWSVTSAGAKKELAALDTAIEDLKAKQQRELQGMQDAHESDKRRLRDSLVRKLRRVRDAMTAATDAHPPDGAAGNPGGQPPTAKINEQLSREVTVLERESTALHSTILELERTELSLTEMLVDHSDGNARLLLRNASHAKTKNILHGKLTQLRGQYDAVAADAAVQHGDKVDALRRTVVMQSNVIEDLNSEIDLQLQHLLGVQARLRASQKASHAQDQRVALAARFLVACGNSEVDDRRCETLLVPSTGDSASGTWLRVDQRHAVVSRLLRAATTPA
jgi:hypothetical protein